MVAGIACTAWNWPGPSCAAKLGTGAQPSSRSTDLGARRHERYGHAAWRHPGYEPHYYARPYYYRPYPYGVVYPFVFGFGPWWR